MNASKRTRRRPISAGLAPYQLHLLDRLAGTIYGSTRADVVRTILASWLTTNAAAVQQAINEYEAWKRSHPSDRKEKGSGE